MTLALRSPLQFVLASAMAAAVALCCMLSFAPHARAADLTQDQLSNVEQLLQSYGVSDAKIHAVAAVLSNNGQAIGQQASSSPCMVPARALMRGMRSDDVRTLQNRLVDEGFLSQDNATGFFGSVTEDAVKQWQASQGLVASGTPETTGWGAVGPKTIEALGRCEAKVHKAEQKLQKVEDRLASTTQRIEERLQNGSNSAVPPPAPAAPVTPEDNSQSSAANVGQFLSDYSDSFNQNLAAVATAPYDFYVPILTDFFSALGVN